MTIGKELAPSLPGPASHTTRLPLLVDICLTVSQIIVLIVAVITAILSILANVEILTVVLRTAAAIIGIGLPLYVFNFLLGRYFVQATLDEMEKTLEESKASENTEDDSHRELEAEA